MNSMTIDRNLMIIAVYKYYLNKLSMLTDDLHTGHIYLSLNNEGHSLAVHKRFNEPCHMMDTEN